MTNVQTTQMRDALAWATNEPAPTHEASSNPFVWFWEAVEGDFNEDRTTAQIMVDAGISMIPLIDQICDVRDIVADCRKLIKDWTDHWAWVSLALTLIGLFPTLGSLAKGVLKIFFAFIRRNGGIATAKAIESGMTWVVQFLRRREVQMFLKSKKVDEVFQWLANEFKVLRGKLDTATLMAAFDRAIKVLETLATRVSSLPLIGVKAKHALNQVKEVRTMADRYLARALEPAQIAINQIIKNLELQILVKQHGIVDAANIHFRGVIPESHAVALMRKRKPKFLSANGDPVFPSVSHSNARKEVDLLSAKIDPNGAPRPVSKQFPALSDQSVASFHKIEAHVVRGPARLYRIISPSSSAMGECWISEEVFRELQRSADPKSAWRRNLAVWPDWNSNGQFVTFDVKAGETLNVWKGPASSQSKSGLANMHLEGGWEQIVFNTSTAGGTRDTMLYYKRTKTNESGLGKSMSQAEVNALTAKMNDTQKKVFFEEHLAVRAEITHPNISGPFETGWGYTDFDGAGFSGRVGLPTLPGQTTHIGSTP